MDIQQLLQNRHSVRAFLPKSIPTEELQEIFNLAQSSVSNCNVQPWQNYVVSGNALKKLSENFIQQLMNGAQPNPDFDWAINYQGVHRERQFGAANALYSAMGIERDDKKSRQMAMARNWQFFDAPHAIFFCMEKYLGIMGAVDMGIYAQTLSLIMQDRGISNCMQGALGQFPEPIRKSLNIPDEIGVLFGMSFGYEDTKANANQSRTNREDTSQAIQFISD